MARLRTEALPVSVMCLEALAGATGVCGESWRVQRTAGQRAVLGASLLYVLPCEGLQGWGLLSALQAVSACLSLEAYLVFPASVHWLPASKAVCHQA